MKRKIKNFLILILFSILVSCKPDIKTFSYYDDSGSSLIPLLISLDTFKDSWSIEEIYEAQRFNSQTSSNEPIEVASRTIWGYNIMLKSDVFLQHYVYKYNFPFKGIEDFPYTVNGKYLYIETDKNGVALYQHCGRDGKTDKISCSFAFILNGRNVVSALGVVLPSKNFENETYNSVRYFLEEIIKSISNSIVMAN